MNTSQTIATNGFPDWQGMTRTAAFDLLPAYQAPGLCFAVPKSASLASRDDGRQAFFLEFFSDRNEPNPDNSLYAMVDMTIEQDGDLADASRHLGAGAAGAAIVPLTFTGGTFVHFECGDSHASAAFAWEDVRRATIQARIALPTARLLYGALASGGVTIARAAIECEVPAVLPRIDASVRFDSAALLHTVRAALAPTGTSVPFDALVGFLDRPPPGLYTMDGTPAPTEPGAPGLGLALAGRLRHYFGSAAACPRVADGPHITLDAADAGPTRWDLRTPLMTGVPRFLRYDPFGFMQGRTTREQVTAFTSVPKLPDELRTLRLTVASGLPSDIANCTQVTLNVRVDKSVSVSGRTEGHTVVLYPVSARSTTLDLHYARIDASKSYSYSVTVIGEDDLTDGPESDAVDDYLFIDSRQLPVGCLSVGATATLLEQASIQFASHVDDAGIGIPGISGLLDALHPRRSFLIDDQVRTGGWLVFTARDRSDAARTLALALPCRSVDLDTSSFHTWGAHSVQVLVHFHEGTTSARLEFGFEDGDTDPIVLGFSTAQPEGRFSYFATRLFKTRYRLRAYTTETGESLPWSDFLMPDQDLHVGMYRQGPRPENVSTTAMKARP